MNVTAEAADRESQAVARRMHRVPDRCSALACYERRAYPDAARKAAAIAR